MLFILPLILIASFVAAAIVFKRKIDAILQNTNFTFLQKLKAYKSASVIRWSIIEIPIPIASAMYFFTSNFFYLIIVFITFVMLNMYAPSKIQIANHLQLNEKEQLILNDDYATL